MKPPSAFRVLQLIVQVMNENTLARPLRCTARLSSRMPLTRDVAGSGRAPDHCSAPVQGFTHGEFCNPEEGLLCGLADCSRSKCRHFSGDGRDKIV